MTTKEELLAKHAGKTGYWEIRTPSDGYSTSHIMFCKGTFEDVLSKALKMREFRHVGEWVGSIEPFTVVDVESQDNTDPK